jgi:probable F420-dependent oxidoreductase
VLAKELATLDVLSGGRVEAGIGAGWMLPDYEQAGMSFDAPGVRVSRMIEAVQIIKGLFGGESFSFSGDHYTITDHEARPLPMRPGGPPVLIAGGGPRMLRFAGAHADIVGLLPVKTGNDAWDDQNLADATDTAMDRKIAWIREGAGDRFADIELSVVVPALIPSDDRAKLADAINGGLAPEVREQSPDFATTSPFVLIGSLDQMEEAMIERRERWGISYYIFNDTSLDAAAPLVARLAGQ